MLTQASVIISGSSCVHSQFTEIMRTGRPLNATERSYNYVVTVVLTESCQEGAELKTAMSTRVHWSKNARKSAESQI